MSGVWNGQGEPPADFLAELYGSDGEDDYNCGEDEDVETFFLSDMDDENCLSGTPSPEPPIYSPLTSPQRRQNQVNLDRSRSPVWEELQPDPLPPLGIVLRIFDEDGMPLDDSPLADLPLDDFSLDEVVNQDSFLTPDAHAMFDSDERLEIELDDGLVADDRNERESVSVTVEEGGVLEFQNDRDGSARTARGRVGSGRRGRVSRRGRPSRSRGGGRRRRVVGPQYRWEVGHPVQEIWVTDDDVPIELREMARDVVRRRQMIVEARTSERSTHAREREVQEEDSESEDEFQDATDGGDNTLLEVENPHFEWSPMESFRGEEETFRQERTGSVESYTTPYDAFRSYWDDGIIQQIVDETNRYATKINSPSFQSDWHPTNSHELLCLFAFWMMLGIIRMPTMQSCFSVNPLLKTEVFRSIFSQTRYGSLNRALQFVDVDPASVAANPPNSDPAASYDRLHRLRPILTHLNVKFQANYVLSKDICIDESLTLWKGRLNIKQYIRSKAAKFGIKTFELCESATGYLWSFLVYTGKHKSSELPDNPLVLKSTAVVKTLIAPLLRKGYRLFMDNWYNTPLLARFLKRNGTDCIGTLRSTRQDVPTIVTQAPLKQGQLIARHSGDICVLSWQDKKRVTMLSTCHGAATGLPRVASNLPTRPLPFKPQVVLNYNRSMGGVDLKDQMLEPYLIERKRCAKWYMKLFKRLLNCSILNARILLQSSMQCHSDQLTFRLQLVDSILTNHLSHCPLPRRLQAAVMRLPHPARMLHHTHWLVRIEPDASCIARNRQTRHRCVVCMSEGRKEQKTPFKCVTCNVPLCVENCYKKYHTT